MFTSLLVIPWLVPSKLSIAGIILNAFVGPLNYLFLVKWLLKSSRIRQPRQSCVSNEILFLLCLEPPTKEALCLQFSFLQGYLLVRMLVHTVIVVQSLSHVWLFVTPGTAAHQASLSITNSQSLLRLMSIESVMPSNHLILCCPLLLPSIFPSIRVFSNESILCIRWPKYRVSVSASVLPMNIQDWFPLGLTDWISLQSNGLSSLLQHHNSKASIFSAQLSFYGPTCTSTHDDWKNHSFDYMDICWQSDICFLICFLVLS